jgi:outer membrane biosynthesis protein TonB
MDRAEASAVGVAIAAHAALLALLGMGFAPTDPPPKQSPIEIELVTEQVAAESTAPTPSAEAPAPLLAPVEGPPEPAPAPPMPQLTPAPQVQPVPQPRVVQPTPQPLPAPKAIPRPQPPQPRPAPKVVQRPQPPRAAAAQPKAARAQPKAATQPAQRTASGPTGRLKGLLSGLSAGSAQSKSASPPAQRAGPAVEASLGAEIRRQLKPHWKSPTGADVEQLRTTVRVNLTRSGGVESIGSVTTTGQTASNRGQVKLHQEQAIRAVRLAAPFRLPAEYYDSWKDIAPVFDRRLSQ